jgi:hypothetical protein
MRLRTKTRSGKKSYSSECLASNANILTDSKCQVGKALVCVDNLLQDQGKADLKENWNMILAHFILSGCSRPNDGNWQF